MKRSLRFVGLLGTATAALMLAAASAGSEVRPRWIVFAGAPENGTQPTQLFRIRVDGSGLQQLTNGRPATAPSFSPDGKRIAYARFNAGISVVSVDGRGRHRVTRGSGDAFPVWSPDGKRIAFLRPAERAARGYRVYLMDANGGHQHLLTHAPWPAGRPSWTADSRRLVIPVARGEVGRLYEVSSTSGRVLERLPLTFDETNGLAPPTLSPDGRTVVFVGCRDPACEQVGLYEARLPAGRPRLLEQAPPVPAGWSADGRTLALPHGYGVELWPLGGGTPVVLSTGTNAVVGEAPPAWQPG
jgi:Tol biopolymer transport system component